MKNFLSKLNPFNWFKTPEPKEFAYHWLHIKSGHKGIHRRKFPNEMAFLHHLNTLNAKHRGEWKYTRANDENLS